MLTDTTVSTMSSDATTMSSDTTMFSDAAMLSDKTVFYFTNWKMLGATGALEFYLRSPATVTERLAFANTSVGCRMDMDIDRETRRAKILLNGYHLGDKIGSNETSEREERYHGSVLGGVRLMNSGWQPPKPGKPVPWETLGSRPVEGPSHLPSFFRFSSIPDGDPDRWSVSSCSPLEFEVLTQKSVRTESTKRQKAFLSGEDLGAIFGCCHVGCCHDSETPFPKNGPTPIPELRGMSREDYGLERAPLLLMDLWEAGSFGSEAEHSRETSIESDLLSIPATSEDDFLWSPSPSNKFAETIARRLLEHYRRETRSVKECRPGAESHDASEGTLHNPGNPVLGVANCTGIQTCRTSSPGKGFYGDDESDGEGSRKQQAGRKLGAVGERRLARPFACPFWKLDPSEYRGCFTLTLKDTSRVKQHLSRKHAPEFYCERCMAVFPDHGTHQAHIRSTPICHPRSQGFAGITHQQQRQLSRKSKASLSERERWFAIWDIVVPGQPKPASPYIDSNLSEDLNRFREFAHSRGPAMIAAEMRDGNTGAPPLTEEQAALDLERAISRGFTFLFETWLAERTSSPSVPPTVSTSSHLVSSASSRPTGGPASSDATRPTSQDNGEAPAPLIPSYEGNAVLLSNTLQEERCSPGRHYEHEDEGLGSNFDAVWDEIMRDNADDGYDLAQNASLHNATGETEPGDVSRDNNLGYSVGWGGERSQG